MVCKTPLSGSLVVWEGGLNDLKDTRDDDQRFARYHPLGFIEFGKMVKIRR